MPELPGTSPPEDSGGRDQARAEPRWNDLHYRDGRASGSMRSFLALSARRASVFCGYTNLEKICQISPGSHHRAALRMNAEAHRPLLTYPPELEIWPLPDMCASQVLLDGISGKWAVLAMATLSRGSARFNQLRRALRGVTQKALTQALRRLERNGMISRTVLETSPVAVEYAITPLGRTLARPFSAVYRWAEAHRSEVEAARRRFDARKGDRAAA
jgi:DNA-binding HxlR family transcriptional regulator